MPGRDEALAALNAALDELICSSVAAEPVGSKDGNGVIAHALHTLVVLLSTQLKHPADARYHRLNTQNANLRRVIALPGAPVVLRALGFSEDRATAGAGGSTQTPSVFWVWRDGTLPTASDLELIVAMRDMLAKRAAAQADS